MPGREEHERCQDNQAHVLRFSLEARTLFLSFVEIAITATYHCKPMSWATDVMWPWGQCVQLLSWGPGLMLMTQMMLARNCAHEFLQDPPPTRSFALLISHIPAEHRDMPWRMSPFPIDEEICGFFILPSVMSEEPPQSDSNPKGRSSVEQSRLISLNREYYIWKEPSVSFCPTTSSIDDRTKMQDNNWFVQSYSGGRVPNSSWIQMPWLALWIS